jgi:hypothetical protein
VIFLKYSWKPGFGFYRNRDAQKIGEELEEIEALKPENAVRYAEQHKGSELYKCLEWDNKKCGEAWRREQARKIIQHIVVVETVREEEGDKQIKIRAFENVNDDDDGSIYLPTRKALDDPEYRECILESIRRGIRELSEKGKNYAAIISNHEGYQKGLDGAMKALETKPRKSRKSA